MNVALTDPLNFEGIKRIFCNICFDQRRMNFNVTVNFPNFSNALSNPQSNLLVVESVKSPKKCYPFSFIFWIKVTDNGSGVHFIAAILSKVIMSQVIRLSPKSNVET